MRKEFVMKLLLITLLLSLLSSCGKKSESDDPNEITTTPPISAEEEPENIISSESFSAKTEKSTFDEGEAIILTLKNIGEVELDHNQFSFGAAPTGIVVTNLNCFTYVKPGSECLYSVLLQNPETKHHKIFVTYDKDGANVRLQLNIKIITNEENPDIHFLYRKNHTTADCENLEKYNSQGIVHSIQLDDFCKVRGKHWNLPVKSEIVIDPMKEFNDHIVDSNGFYCGDGWTIHSFQFEQTQVTEIKNFLGGKRTVTIPPGESREVCTRRNIFGCRERKVFYSRLVSVNCY